MHIFNGFFYFLCPTGFDGIAALRCLNGANDGPKVVFENVFYFTLSLPLVAAVVTGLFVVIVTKYVVYGSHNATV